MDVRVEHAPRAAMSLEEMIDLKRLDVGDASSSGYRRAVSSARRDLAEAGCAVVSGFLRPQAVALLNEELLERKHLTYYTRKVENPYYQEQASPDHPRDHPLNAFTERTSGFLPGDAWEPDTAAKTLFNAPELAGFVADCLGEDRLHCYRDPLAGLTANICEAGQGFPWHFDTNDFAVSLMVQQADEGGVFEWAPSVRSDEDECFDDVAAVLRGDRTVVRALDLRPGDLQIFQGRLSLHRVTRVAAGSRARHVLIFSFTRKPHVIGRVARTRQLYGKVLPEHEHAERQPVRSDALID